MFSDIFIVIALTVINNFFFLFRQNPMKILVMPHLIRVKMMKWSLLDINDLHLKLQYAGSVSY